MALAPPVGSGPLGDHRLARSVARVPARIRSKLLVAFAVIVGLFIAIGTLGVGALSESNRRAERLERLQDKAAAYRSLQNDNSIVRQLVAAKSGTDILRLHFGGDGDMPPPSKENISTTLDQLHSSYDAHRLGFVATLVEQRVLTEIEADYNRLVAVVREALDLDRAGQESAGQQLVSTQALPIANRLEETIDRLANQAETDIVSVVSANRAALAASRRTFLASALVSIVLALVLGFAISSSVIGPVQRVDARLSEIAAGDFSAHIHVANRDELGTLAGNLNRMNDELGRLYDVVRSQAAKLADWNRTLETRVEQQAQELRASRARIVATADDERRRIERDLHDGAQQHLVALAVNLNLARAELDVDTAAAAALLDQLVVDVRSTIDDLRGLAHGIYPPVLLESGLPVAITAIAARSVSEISVVADGVVRHPPEVEAAVYFCCLEALQNAAKHAAGAVVGVRLWEEPGALCFEISDDGPGFDPAAVTQGQGLVNIGDRVAAVGGRVICDSTPGAGTQVSGWVPLPAGLTPETTTDCASPIPG